MAAFQEFLRMLDGEQNHLLQLLLDIFQTPDILPLDVGNFDVSLSKGGRVDISHGEFEMVL